MKTGTPGFVGERLREAREARSLTIVTLAELAGVSRQAISDWEHGSASPQPENLYRIASILDLPVAFFSLPPRREEDVPTFYRSLAGASKTSRIAASRRIRWVSDIAEHLAEYVEFPPMQFPALIERGQTPLSPDAIEEAAAQLRVEWALEDLPIHNTVALIESKGGFVARTEAESEAIDAFSRWLRGTDRPCIFLGSEKNSRARSRFDAAHEIGHMVMHRSVAKTQVAVPAQLSVLETEANAFASAFLLPAESFAEDLYIPTLDGMRALKPKWKVSVAAMLYRATDLGIVSGDTARRMWTLLAKRGWRRSEPDDDLIPPETPTALSRAFEIVVAAGVLSPAQMLDRIPFSARDVQRFAALPPEFFGVDVAPVRLLDRPRPTGPGDNGAERGGLVPFRNPN